MVTLCTKLESCCSGNCSTCWKSSVEHTDPYVIFATKHQLPYTILGQINYVKLIMAGKPNLILVPRSHGERACNWPCVSIYIFHQQGIYKPKFLLVLLNREVGILIAMLTQMSLA